ncbi:MAG: hypothetical protein ACOX2L_06115 [Anaerolineae bacterium]|jgi:hypothetical protein|nr:hypothetical protein [Chloroflexota bacterium]
MEDWSARPAASDAATWRECRVVAVAQSLAQAVTCRSLPRGHMFRARLFSERIAEMRRRFTNLEELVLQLPLCEEYRDTYGPLCCDAMMNLEDPDRCTAMDEALDILQKAASAAARTKYRMWRMGIYD